MWLAGYLRRTITLPWITSRSFGETYWFIFRIWMTCSLLGHDTVEPEKDPINVTALWQNLKWEKTQALHQYNMARGPWFGVINAKEDWKWIPKIVRTQTKSVACLWANESNVTKQPKQQPTAADPWKTPHIPVISMSFLSFSCTKQIHCFTVFFISTNDMSRAATYLLSR
jgi:hypothetical protein